jgi:hypothetical protein
MYEIKAVNNFQHFFNRHHLLYHQLFFSTWNTSKKHGVLNIDGTPVVFSDRCSGGTQGAHFGEAATGGSLHRASHPPRIPGGQISGESLEISKAIYIYMTHIYIYYIYIHMYIHMIYVCNMYMCSKKSEE